MNLNVQETMDMPICTDIITVYRFLDPNQMNIYKWSKDCLSKTYIGICDEFKSDDFASLWV